MAADAAAAAAAVWDFSKETLVMSLKNDTSWLNTNQLVDYSLLCGMDMSTNELVMGIIDYHRMYRTVEWLEDHFKGVGGDATYITCYYFTCFTCSVFLPPFNCCQAPPLPPPTTTHTVHVVQLCSVLMRMVLACRDMRWAVGRGQ